MLASIGAQFPPRLRAMGEAETRRFVARAMAHADALGLHVLEDHPRVVCLWLVYGETLLAQTPWAARLLADPQAGTPSDRIRAAYAAALAALDRGGRA